MPNPQIFARVIEQELHCTITFPSGKTVTLSGDPTGAHPQADWEETLRKNPALVSNAWAYATLSHQRLTLSTVDEQKAAEKRAEAHRKLASRLASLVDRGTESTRDAWCSACFARTEHMKVQQPKAQIPAWLCDACGSPTIPCAAPSCTHMAVRGPSAASTPRYCAEHRHDIPGFAKAEARMEDLSDYRNFLEYDKPHLSRVTKIAGLSLAGVALAPPAALAAAPAIGGAIGSLIGGYSGAVATSYGLALLGGGSVAAGGLGMAGGTLVVTTVGAAVGGTLGASITNAYLGEDKSFHIEMLRGGSGVPVVVCNGFLTEQDRGWGGWKDMVTGRYPDSPVYRVHWGSKELRKLGLLIGGMTAKGAGAGVFAQLASSAMRVGPQKLAPFGPALIAADLAKNPWHVAKNRAEKTGVIIADLLGRTTADAYVLVGHSLGARAMVVAAQTLGTKKDGPQVEAVHLLGAAIKAEGNWETLATPVTEAVYNYHSSNDPILKNVYPLAQGSQAAAGLKGFTPVPAKLENVDCSVPVTSHSGYFNEVELK